MTNRLLEALRSDLAQYRILRGLGAGSGGRGNGNEGDFPSVVRVGTDPLEIFVDGCLLGQHRGDRFPAVQSASAADGNHDVTAPCSEFLCALIDEVGRRLARHPQMGIRDGVLLECLRQFIILTGALQGGPPRDDQSVIPELPNEMTEVESFSWPEQDSRDRCECE